MSIPCKMRPMGGSLPLGYIKVEYLDCERDAAQYIETPIYLDKDCEISATFLGDYKTLICRTSPLNGAGLLTQTATWDYGDFGSWWGEKSPYGSVGVTDTNILKIGEKGYIKNSATGMYYNGRFWSRSNPSLATGLTKTKFFASAVESGYKGARIYECAITKNGRDLFRGISVLDPRGAPCMFDLVSRKPFRNEGTGQFIAGMTLKQARHLANLPATGGSLTVSLPLEAAFDAGVQNALTAAADKGWTITVQYRESELTTENIEADFLASTGTQWIDTSYYPCWDSIINTEACFLSSATSEALYASVEDKTEGEWDEAYFIARYNGAPGGWVSHGKQSGISEIANLVKNGIKQIFNASKDGIFVDGLKVDDALEPTIYRNVYSLYLFARNYLGNVELPAKARIWNFEVKEKGIIERKFISCISPSGTPCMHDTVSGQNFYNQGTGAFTVGFDTTEKAAISLSKLPITTNGTLTVSLPSEAGDTDTLVPAAIDIAKSRGWTIIAQYRED